jgi:hypothetical protein
MFGLTAAPRGVLLAISAAICLVLPLRCELCLALGAGLWLVFGHADGFDGVDYCAHMGFLFGEV